MSECGWFLSVSDCVNGWTPKTSLSWVKVQQREKSWHLDQKSFETLAYGCISFLINSILPVWKPKIQHLSESVSHLEWWLNCHHGSIRSRPSKWDQVSVNIWSMQRCRQACSHMREVWSPHLTLPEGRKIRFTRNINTTFFKQLSENRNVRGRDAADLDKVYNLCPHPIHTYRCFHSLDIIIF